MEVGQVTEHASVACSNINRRVILCRAIPQNWFFVKKLLKRLPPDVIRYDRFDVGKGRIPTQLTRTTTN